MQAPQEREFRRLSVQPGLRGSNDLRVESKMAIFQLFFQSGQAKNLSATLYSRELCSELHAAILVIPYRRFGTTYRSRNVGKKILLLAA